MIMSMLLRSFAYLLNGIEEKSVNGTDYARHIFLCGSET